MRATVTPIKQIEKERITQQVGRVAIPINLTNRETKFSEFLPLPNSWLADFTNMQ